MTRELIADERVGEASPPAGRPRRHAPWIALLALVCAGVQAAFGLQQYYRLRLGGYDLTIFDQAIRAYSKLHMPVSEFKYTRDFAQVKPGFPVEHFSILGDHFSPILALAAPFYWVWNDPRVLLLAQALAFGATVPVVWVFTRRALARFDAGAWVPYGVALAFGVSWELQEATQAGFHESGFILFFSALMIERAQAEKWRQCIAATIVLLLCKEDMGLVVAMFGVVLFLRGKRRMGLAYFAGGVVFVELILKVWIPALGGRSNYYWYYGRLGKDIPSALWHIVSNPIDTVHVAVTPAIKWHVVLYLLWPLLFLPLASPITLLAVPLLAERLFSDNSNNFDYTQHYNAMLAAILFLAAVDGAVRVLPPLARRFSALDTRRAVQVWAAAVTLIGVALCSYFPMRRVFIPSQWQRSDQEKAAITAIGKVPDGAFVEVDNNAATYLSSRARVLLLEPTVHDADWILMEIDGQRFPFTTFAQQMVRYDQAVVSEHYTIVYEQDGWVLLRRG